MKEYFILANPHLLLLFIVCTSCNGQARTGLPEGDISKTQTIPDNGLGLPKTQGEMKAFLDAGVDPYFIEPKDTSSTQGPQCIVRNLIQDRAGYIWLATWQGIIKYDGKVFTNYTLKEGLIHFHVGSLFEDSEGNIWFGTARGGVYRYDGKSFTLFTTRDGLPDNTINCIAEDKNRNIWFGTENGASRYDGKAFANFTTKDGLSDNNVIAVMRDKTGMMWFGTAGGVNCFDGKSFTEFTSDDGMSFQRVASLFEDKAGNIWIGSAAKQAGGKGLCRYDGRSVSNFITPYFVMYMCGDWEGNLWLAHNKGADNVNFALYSYDGKLFTKIMEQNGPNNPVIFGIMEDKNGDIWFGTANGVCRYDGKTFNYFAGQ